MGVKRTGLRLSDGELSPAATCYVLPPVTSSAFPTSDIINRRPGAAAQADGQNKLRKGRNGLFL
jgi:hypothetical protein